MMPPPPATRRAPPPAPVPLRWQIWLPWIGLALILLSATGTDPDLWGHVRFGLDILQNHDLPSVDPYSFTQDRPWVNHEWLSEALMAAAFAHGGTAGLVLLKTAVMAGAMAIVWRQLRGSSPLLGAAVTTLAIVGVLPLSGTMRPQIWSVLGLTLLVPLLGERPPSRRSIAAAAVLFCAWANLHGGWITGGAALALYATIRTLRAPREAGRWLALGVASLAATLLNPYGIGLWRFLAATVRSSRPDISEWAPFGVHEPAIMWVSVIGPLALLTLLLRRRDARPPLEIYAVVLLLTAAGLRVSRVAPLVCPASLALMAPYVTRAWGRLGALSAPSAAAALVLLLPGIAFLAAAFAPLNRALSCVSADRDWAPDRAAAAQLRGRTGTLWTTFNWGEYAIWHFGPALRVSIDGRRETVYSNQIIAWHRAVEAGDASAIARMVALRPDYVWLPLALTAVREAIVRQGYRTDIDTGASFVATRSDLPIVARVVEPLPRCFP